MTDPRALAEAYVSLAKGIAGRMHQRCPGVAERDDFESAAYLGLVEAAQRYRHDVGVPFSAYAVPRIRGAVVDWMRTHDLLSRDMRRHANELAAVEREITAALGRPPTDDERSAALGVDLETLRRKQHKTMAPRRAFDTPDYDGPSLIERVADTAEVGESWLSGHDIRRALRHLPERCQQVLRWYYVDELLLVQIGERLGVTESRASQLLTEARERMQVRMLPFDPDVTDEERLAYLQATDPRKKRERCMRGHLLSGRNVKISVRRTTLKRTGEVREHEMRRCRRCDIAIQAARRRASGIVPIDAYKPPRQPLAKLSDAEAADVLLRVAARESFGAIAARYKVSRRVIRLIWLGETYRQVQRPPGLPPRPTRARERIGARKLTDADVLSVIRDLDAGVTAKDVARRLGVSGATISDIRTGRTYSAVTGRKRKARSRGSDGL